jgi:alpha-beta hydrolase superfamily lysophospholipase
MDFNIRLSNGQVLRGFIKSPGDNLRGVVILIHGRGEHIQRYKKWAESFNREKIAFAGVDLPGHGLSDGKRGHIKNYKLTDEMIDILINECKMTFPDVPVFLYGHSLGGGIVLDYLVRMAPKLKGAIVTSPWLILAFKPEESMVKIATMMRNIFPSLILPAGLVEEHLSHDQKVVDAFKNDPLTHNKISLSLFHAANSAASNALKNASSVKTPLLLIHGSDDKICSPDGSREFASKTKFAELKIWEGGYHELQNELFKKDVFNYIINWINLRLSGKLL